MKRVTRIRVLGETWSVPRGFGAAYKRFARDFTKSNDRVIIACLALVGYAATEEQVKQWPSRKRVEAAVYAATEHARASDNPILRHPRPRWLPEKPWDGPTYAVGNFFDGPSPTPVLEEAA